VPIAATLLKVYLNDAVKWAVRSQELFLAVLPAST